MTASTDPQAPARVQRFRPWPLWMTAAGLLGLTATVLTDRRPAAEAASDDYTVSVADIPGLDHVPFRVGGFVGYLCVAALIVLAAVWHRRVARGHAGSLGAAVVTYGLVAAAAALTLAYGWKGALGNYLHGAGEAGTYDDAGLYVYYVMNDFSPYIGWVPVAVALGGLAWMGLRERLVSRGLGAFAGLFCLLAFGAVAATGVPGLPFVSLLALSVCGVWLACGRSVVVREDAG